MMGRSLGHLGEIDPKDWRELDTDLLLGPWWLGDFAPELSTKDFGNSDFHGRFHPAIPYVAMRRFTKPGDVVWDCFAGSGTTIDVGKMLGREVIATDLKPTRDDIIEADAGEYDPGTKVDLLIMHPPYWNIVDYGDLMSRANSLDDYRDEFAWCFENTHRYLKKGHVCVVVIGEVWVDGELYPLEYVADEQIRFYYEEYRLIGRIVKDYGLQSKGGATRHAKNENLWKQRLLKNGYFRYGIDTVLFYQKRS